jgi:hypothetical protein
MLRDFFEKRRIKQAFSRIVAPDAVEAVLRGDELETVLKQGHLQFALASVRGTPAEISDRVGLIGDVAMAHSLVVFSSLGPLVAVASGMHSWSPPDATRRLAFVEDLRRQLGDDVKILHGTAIGHYGLLGKETGVVFYSFLLPHFDSVLAALVRLEFGAAKEFLE